MKTYDTYKNSGIDWLGEIPSHWEENKIKNFFKSKSSLFIDGDWIESKDINGEDVYYFTTGNINELHFKDNERSFISEQTFKRLNCTAIAEKDILVSRLNVPLGRCCLAPSFDKKSIVSVDVVVFRPDEIYNRKFLVYVMNSPSYFQNTENIARGAIMKRISRSILGNIKLPIPPIHEQEAIATFLDEKCGKIDALVEIKSQQIEKLKELRQVKIHQAVTKGLEANVELKDSGIDWIGDIPKHWEVKRLASLGKFSKGGGFSKADLVEENGVPAILYGDIYTKYNYTIKESVRLISGVSAANAVQLEYDDLLFTGSGESKEDIGKCVAFKSNTKTVAGGDVIIFKQIDNLSNYLSYCLNTEGAKYEKARSSKGEIIVHTYASKLREIFISIPPIQEQEAIVAYLDAITGKIDQAIGQKQEQIEKLKQYKQSLINEVVTGKVRVC